MNDPWRLIIDAPLAGAANMARDEAIATAVAERAAPPTLRLYAWRPACLSLGRFQRSGEIDRAACARAGVDIVRRPSGGRALLHDHELTYAVIAHESHPLLGGDTILASYRQISAALLAGLRALGVPAELTPAQRRPAQSNAAPAANVVPHLAAPSAPASFTVHPSSLHSAACFDAPASYELTVGGRKLVGSAQRRQQGAIVQHGAIPLTPHAERLNALLLRPQPSLGAKMITLREAAGRAIEFAELADALIAGFADAWGAHFTPGGLTPAEHAHERRLLAETYANDAWTFGR